MSVWPLVALGEVLWERKQFVLIDDSSEYKRCRVQAHAKGVVLRDQVSGMEVKTKRQQVCRPGEFLVAEIDAKVGGYGIVPPDLDGAIVSSHYFLFEVNAELLARRFLDLYIRTSDFGDQVKAVGSTNYAAIRPAHVLGYTIPLPPLAEQRRIVARVEALAAQIGEARNLRKQATEEAVVIVTAAATKAMSREPHWEVKQVGTVCFKPQYGFTESASRDEVGPRFLRITDIQDGMVNWQTVPYCRCPHPAPYLLAPGDLVFARTGATTGKSFLIGACPASVFASYLIRLRVKEAVLPQFIFWYFQSQTYWDAIMDARSGTGQPNVNGQKLAALEVPVPPLPEQRRIVEYLDGLQAKVDAVKALQAQTAAELDALLPSILQKAFSGGL